MGIARNFFAVRIKKKSEVLKELCEYIVNTWNDTKKADEKDSRPGLKNNGTNTIVFVEYVFVACAGIAPRRTKSSLEQSGRDER